MIYAIEHLKPIEFFILFLIIPFFSISFHLFRRPDRHSFQSHQFFFSHTTSLFWPCLFYSVYSFLLSLASYILTHFSRPTSHFPHPSSRFPDPSLRIMVLISNPRNSDVMCIPHSVLNLPYVMLQMS